MAIKTPAPLMSPPEIVLFKKYLDNAVHYFEFGCGGSTVLADTYNNIKSIKSVEADQLWLSDISSIVSDKVEFIPIRFDVAGWSSPTNPDQKHLWENYSSCINYTNKQYDLILLDGRFRTACGIQSYSRLKDDGFILIHDYDEVKRTTYALLKNIYDIVEIENILCVLKKKQNITEDILTSMWNEFKHVSQ